MSYKAQLDYYFLHNYSVNCPPTPYLATNEFMLTAVHSYAPFSLFFSFYGIFCILSATPKTMENAKSGLLHLQLASLHLDFTAFFSTTPYVYFLTPAVLVNGFFYDVGIPGRITLLIGVFGLIAYGVALLMFMENRFSAILTNPFRITRTSTRVAYFVFSYVACFSVYSIHILDSFDPDYGKLGVLAEFPCPERHFFDERTVLLTMIPLRHFAVMLIVLGYIGACFALFTIYSAFLLLKRPNMKVSEKTRRLQKNFFFVSLFQILLPLFFMAVPISFGLVIIVLGFADSSHIFNPFYLILVSLHSLISSISLVLIYKPYREFTFKLFKGNIKRPFNNKTKNSSVLVVTK